ncbi:TATA-binding protein-associated phosphoprotein [Entamoeba marina]
MQQQRKSKEIYERYSEKEKEMKNYECYEQAILLCLLNKFCSITIQKPFKQSTTITTKPEVISLHFETETIDIRSLAEQQCLGFYKKSLQDKVRPKTALRRNAKNKSTFTINFLFDIAIEHGFMFNSVLSKRSTKCLQVERIQHIFKDNIFLMDSNDIIYRGYIINAHLCSITKNQTKVTIPQNDPALQRCLTTTLKKPIQIINN